MTKRGDVVLVHIPYVDVQGGKNRPAVIIQRDEYNNKLTSTIVAAIASRLKKEPTHYILDPTEPEGKAAGVLQASAIRCDRLFTVDQKLIRQTIGHLAPGTVARVDDCLRAALGLPPQAEPVMGNYELWPDHRKLIWNLETFIQILRIDPHGIAFLTVDLVMERSQWNTVHRFSAKDIDLIPPSNKEEFKKSGNSIRICFSPTDDTSASILNGLVPSELAKIPIHRVTFWANSGAQNTLNSVFDCTTLNEGAEQLYVQDLTNGRYEVGFDASGNVNDSLLLGGLVRFASNPDSS
jgi:mRNA interferase MazF